MDIADLQAKAMEAFKSKGLDWKSLEGGTETGTTMRHNREALDKIKLRLEVIHDIEPETKTKILGREVQTPIMNAPLSGLVFKITPDAQKIIAKAAERAGTFAFIGDPAGKIDEIVSSTKAPVVKIVKPYRDNEAILSSMREAKAAGCFAVGIDVDTAAEIKVGHSTINYGRPMAPKSMADLRLIRAEAKLPLIIKGVQSVKDIERAIEIGADAVVVSNHGGRVLDAAQAPIETMKEIPFKLKNKIEILVDSGFRQGSDVLKGLALGASAVLVGRPIVWALAAGGEDGIANYISDTTAELRRAMLLTGIKRVGEANHEIVRF